MLIGTVTTAGARETGGMVEKLIEKSSKYKEAGIAGLFALVLLGFVLNQQTQGMERLQAQVADMRKELTEHVGDTTRLLYAICLNIANDAGEIARCQEPHR